MDEFQIEPLPYEEPTVPPRPYSLNLSWRFTKAASARLPKDTTFDKWKTSGLATLPIIGDLVRVVYAPDEQFVVIEREFFVGPDGQSLTILLDVPAFPEADEE